MNVPLSIRGTASLSFLFAFGLGVPCLMAIRSLASGRGIAYVFGFPAYGGGGFERHGLNTSIRLLLAFLLVCILEAIAGLLLSGGHKSGAILSLVLLAPGALFWWGFDLPYPPIAAAMQIVLLVMGWPSLI